MALMVFLRHGQALNNVEKILAGRTPGFGLTSRGTEQSRSAAHMLESLKINKIYCSPIKRAHQTAKIVAEKVKADIILDDRLLELDMGSFTGLKYADLLHRYGNVFERFYYEDPELAKAGIETFSDVKRRISSMTEHVLKHHREENVLLVTHMDPIKAILANVTGLHSASLCKLVIANASLNVFAHYDGSIYLKSINILDATRLNDDW